ncbi:MAG: hypothetical protein K2Y01_02905 [Rhabdochlamydiaceae bacterium]|nr:hypothetical protein [Rhabdochlamydiaceae bacterium]
MIFFCFVIHTANMLGIFSDPFEFEGKYGSDQDPIRQKVFECIVAKESLYKNLSDEEIRDLLHQEMTREEIQKYRSLLVQKAIREDRAYGPTVRELISPELVQVLREKQQMLEKEGFTKAQLHAILQMLENHQEEKVFYFLRHSPSELLSLDKKLRDEAVRNGKNLELPILSSMQVLEGSSPLALKKNLLDALFIPSTFNLTLDEEKLQNVSIELEAFYSPAGQVFFYWMYQALNLHLVSQDPQMIVDINKAKEQFANTIGDPKIRADFFKSKVMQAESAVIFAQESDAIVPQILEENGDFLPVAGQNLQDGTIIFLRSDVWEPEYEVLSLEEYEGFASGKVNLLLATHKKTGQKFLLASGHGHSTRAEDGRLQVTLVMETFHKLLQDPKNSGLQLLMGTDANTKTEEDVKKFQEHADRLGLITTRSGPTTIKKRMVTVQHSKSGRSTMDEEDYLLTLKPENGGCFSFSHLTVGFQEEGLDLSVFLPSKEYPFDHYSVGVSLEKLIP